MAPLFGIPGLLAALHAVAAPGLFYGGSELCGPQWVFIASAVESRPYAFEWPSVMTAVTLSVEAVAHGTPPPTVTVRFVGGELNGRRVSPEPAMQVGRRYLVAASPLSPMEGAVLPRDGTVLVGWWTVEAVPGEGWLRERWVEECVGRSP